MIQRVGGTQDRLCRACQGKQREPLRGRIGRLSGTPEVVAVAHTLRCTGDARDRQKAVALAPVC